MQIKRYVTCFLSLCDVLCLYVMYFLSFCDVFITTWCTFVIVWYALSLCNVLLSWCNVLFSIFDAFVTMWCAFVIMCYVMCFCHYIFCRYICDMLLLSCEVFLSLHVCNVILPLCDVLLSSHHDKAYDDTFHSRCSRLVNILLDWPVDEWVIMTTSLQNPLIHLS